MSIHIISIDNNNELSKFKTTTSSENIALTLYSWRNHCYVDFLNILNDEEIDMLKVTYTKESFSVQEGYKSFNPIMVSPSKIKPIFEKIRDNYIFQKVKEKGDEHLKFVRDLIILSECIGALETLKSQTETIYIAIED